ncbi:MAG: hypothetical protein ACFFA3_06680 [Promethearchaeota archaeon]
MPDEFKLNNEIFSLIGLKGEGLFSPEDFGITPYFNCTACWRGYVMKYIISEDQLVLDEMRVNVDDPPKINDIEPMKEGDLFKYKYKNLNLKPFFTGKLLLAKDFIDSMYVHMGFQRPIAFKTVVEIHVKNGDINLFKDISKEIEKERYRDPSKGAQPISKSKDDIEKWIEETFSLEYD